MAEKKIIELNQTGDRVKELLDQIDTTYDTTKSNAETAITKATSLEATVADLSDEVGTQGVTISSYEGRIKTVEDIAATYDLTYSDDLLRLRQTKGDVTEIVSEVKIVSASETVSSVITVTRVTSASSTVTLEEPGVIEYKVESLQDGVETGDLTVTWKVNNTTVLTETIKQGTNTFKLDGRVAAGNNGITATFVDSIGTSYTSRWSVDVIDMYITSTFNDTTTYSGDANISFTAYGMVTKTVYFLLNGEEVYSTDISTSGVQSSYILSHQPHGAHTLEIYCKATMNNGREIESTHLYYDVMFTDEGNLTPIIRWPYSGKDLTQYKATVFEYSVYTPNSLTSDVELYIDNKLISSQNVDRTEQEWVYKPQKPGENILFTIKVGDVTKQKTLNVAKFPYDVNPIEGAVFDFNPTGKTNNDVDYDSWTDGKHTLSVSQGFDWTNGGWKQDENNDTYFCVKAGSRAYLSFPMFESEKDVKETGKNFKFIFKTTNNRAIKDTAISCLASKTITNEDGSESISKIGIVVGTQEANLYAATKEIEVQYVENEKIELEFNITKSGDRQNLILGYINSDPVRVIKYDNNASFNSWDYQAGVPITIGNDTCDVHIYRIKCYNMELTDKDIMQNYIADATNSDDMIVRYERNDILDEAGEELDYNKLSKLYPELRIILITCPRFTFDKDDKVKKCTVQHIMGNGDPMHNWTATNVQVKGQGTSSNEYGTSARNIDIKLNKVEIDGVEQNYAFTYGDDKTTGSKYAMTENSVEVNYFNIKVNVASSENANNACLAERFFKFNPYVRQARIDNPKVRDTMEFHPCVIFLKELGTDTEYGNQEFPTDGKFHFYACGDFGNSKKNHAAFGMDTDAYDDYLKAVKDQNTDTPVDADGQPLPMPTEAIIEISNNSAAGCRFKFADGWTEILPDVDPTPTWNEKDQKWEYLDVWGGDVVEFRYPEDLFDIIENEKNEFSEIEVSAANRIFNSLKNEVRVLWNWVASTDTTTATNVTFEAPITYNEKDSNDNIIYYDKDSVEYRKAKFKYEYENYFIKDSLLYNYLFTDRYLMIDNRAKNVFIHTVDGNKWDFCFDYDNDTALGCDNRGTLKYEYYYEDIDKFGSEDVYNAADSVLWVNVRNCLFDELGAAYRSNSFYTAKGTIDDFNTYQGYKPERLEMFDMRRKYIRPYTDGHYAKNISEGKVQSYEQYLPMLNGRKKYQRQAFETYREAYTNSKYQVVSDTTALSFRASAEKGTNITVTPYCWLYVHVDYDGPDFGPIRTEANQEVTVSFPLERLGDTNTHIYHPEWIKAVNGLDKWYIRNANFDSGTRLTKLILGSEEDGYSNEKQENHTLSISNARLLEELNVCGWKMPSAWELNLKTNSNLKKLHATNANISSIEFANGGLVEEVKVDSFTALSAVNLKNLKTFEVKSLTPVTKIRIENTPIISSDTFLSQCTNLLRMRLIGIDWALPDAQLLDRFIVLSGIDENGKDINKFENEQIVPGGSVVAGKVFVDTIKESQLLKYEADWPNLTITFNNQIEQHAVTYVDWDGTVLYETFVDEFGLPIDPVAEGLIPTPTRESTVSHSYTYAGWSGDLEAEVVGPKTFTAQYTETIRKYTIKWWKETTDKDPIYTQEYNYGEDAVYPHEMKPIYREDSRSYNLFKGWDKSTSFVNADLNVYALWENGRVSINSLPEIKDLTAAQIYTLVQNNNETVFQDEFGAPSGDRITINMGTRPNYSNLNAQVLIDKPTYFDGTANTLIDTGITLFSKENDKDWTLLIDGKFGAGNTNGSTLVACYRSQDGAGLSWQYDNTYAGPVFIWGADDKAGVREWGQQRDIYIISHKKGEPQVKVYVGDLAKNTPSEYVLDNISKMEHSITLTLGGKKTINNKYTDYGNGVLFNVILWDSCLGDSDCRAMAMWPWDTYSFDIASFEDYFVNEDRTETTALQFFSSQLVPFRTTVNMGDGDICYFNTAIDTWLEERFYKALPIQWQAAICTAQIPAVKYNPTSSSSEIVYENRHIWIPSIKEIGSSFTEAGQKPYMNEGIAKVIYASDTSRRFALGAAMKEAHPSSTAELQAKDWCYVRATDPMLDSSITLENGDVWCQNNNYYIYKDFAWYQWREYYHLRSTTVRGNRTLYYMQDTGNGITQASYDSTRSFLPGFALRKN